MKSYPFVKQTDKNDCGIACLKMISIYYNKPFNPTSLHIELKSNGINLKYLKLLAEELGFTAKLLKINSSNLEILILNGPLILHWQGNHFVVLWQLIKIEDNRELYIISNPSYGTFEFNKEKLIQNWIPNNINDFHNLKSEGIVLYLY